MHAYADDSQLYLSFKSGSEDNQTEAVDAAQECIEDISAWMTADQLKLIEDKTEVILLLALHWLLVKFRICYKIAVISFKAIRNLQPTYFSNLINIERCSRYNLRLRSNVGVILHDPTVKFKCTLGDRSFTAAAPKKWNGLPDYTKNSKRMILISLRDSLRRTILKRPIATCLELS